MKHESNLCQLITEQLEKLDINKDYEFVYQIKETGKNDCHVVDLRGVVAVEQLTSTPEKGTAKFALKSLRIYQNY